MNVQIPHLECKRCGHRWAPRKSDVRICPKCKSASWDKKKDKKGGIMKISVLLALLTSSCLADDIVMKDGQKIPFRSIVDQGQTYDVVGPDGKKLSVRKAEIERVLVDPSAPPLTGASFTKISGKTKSVNALAAVDPKRDLTGQNCKIEPRGTALVCDLRCDVPTWVSVPVRMPVEYDLTLVLERSDGVSNFYVSLIGGGAVPFFLKFDDEGKSGLWGQKMVPGAVLPKGEQVTIVVGVRKDSLTVQANDREIVSWRGKWSDLAIPPDHAPAKGKGLPFFGSQKIFGTVPNLWTVHRMTVTTN